MAIDEGILFSVEQALGFELYDWQRAYLTDEPIKIDIRMIGRRQGHTTAHILKLLLEDTEAAPLNLTNQRAIVDIADWWSYTDYHRRYDNIGYIEVFKRDLIYIKTILKEHGIQSRSIAVSKGETHFTRDVVVW